MPLSERVNTGVQWAICSCLQLLCDILVAWSDLIKLKSFSPVACELQERNLPSHLCTCYVKDLTGLTRLVVTLLLTLLTYVYVTCTETSSILFSNVTTFTFRLYVFGRGLCINFCGYGHECLLYMLEILCLYASLRTLFYLCYDSFLYAKSVNTLAAV